MDEQEERVQWYIKTWECANGNCKKVKYPVVPDGVRPRKGSRRQERSVRRAEKYALDAKHDLSLLLNNNFSAGRDRFVTLTVDGDGWDRLVMRAGTDDRDELYTALEREAVNFMRRAKRACLGAGGELKAVYVVSDLDGKTFEPARPHVHMVMSGSLAELAAGKWTLGSVQVKPMRSGEHGDLTGVAEYMIDQVRTRPGKSRYHPTRNLEKPEGVRVPAKSPDYPLQVPANATLIWRSGTAPGMSQTIRYYIPPEKRRKKPKKKQGGTHHGKGKRTEH